MDTINTHFRLSHKIVDEAFDLSQATRCNLYVSLSQKAMRLAVADAERNKFLVLIDYELITVFTPLQVAEQLQLIATENPLLQEKSWNTIKVSFSNQQFTLVPETLYDPAHQSDYLRLHADLNPIQDQVLAYRHSTIGAMNIFAVDAALFRTLQDIFSGRPIQMLHQTSALIRSVLHQGSLSAKRNTCIFVERDYVTILVVGQNGLEFCNVFQYHTPEDFIYYIVFVMQEQKMDPEQETITVWGDITHDSSLFHMLQRYIRYIKLGKKPTDVDYSYKFHDLFEHRYFELYSLHLCE
ncbi:uncharacterized protein DUF3822 [Pontibacter ummariensis]|uniref:DUF3822 domain-containing protein n=1 Tax=Pontibacter ummariensis TaxID=1610492 RepID=A0A239C6L0_9BACT|nr:DUF3822 family protein [Pontibacter ummariensis]PRY15442.1 uncharacterized protein DUF3822 [Pontibacter ummariensis]SNS15251.1 Protein of unknown function [Pontibacter ummariensis]